MSFAELGWYALAVYVITQIGVIAELAVRFYLSQRKQKH